MKLVISGPGGVGKGAVVKNLVRLDGRYMLSRSWTTRPIRPSESEDAYIFASRAEFEESVSRGSFIEWTEFLGNYYGTPKAAEPEGTVSVYEINVAGARALAASGKCLMVCLVAPNAGEHKRRLVSRGDELDHVEARLRIASREVDDLRSLGATIVENNLVAESAQVIHSLVMSRLQTVELVNPGTLRYAHEVPSEIAQLAEQLTVNQRVAGSSPALGAR